MPECEYHDSICVAIYGLDPEMDCGADEEECHLRNYLNSPQFKEQYANREELWKETKKCTLPIAEMYRELEGSPKVPVITLVQANKIIRTHGLEE